MVYTAPTLPEEKLQHVVIEGYRTWTISNKPKCNLQSLISNNRPPSLMNLSARPVDAVAIAFPSHKTSHITLRPDYSSNPSRIRRAVSSLRRYMRDSVLALDTSVNPRTHLPRLATSFSTRT